MWLSYFFYKPICEAVCIFTIVRVCFPCHSLLNLAPFFSVYLFLYSVTGKCRLTPSLRSSNNLLKTVRETGIFFSILFLKLFKVVKFPLLYPFSVSEFPSNTIFSITTHWDSSTSRQLCPGEVVWLLFHISMLLYVLMRSSIHGVSAALVVACSVTL